MSNIPMSKRLLNRAPQFYRGFTIYYRPSNPVTGRWVAMRHGVRLNGHSWEALRSVINNHTEENKR